MKKLLSYLILLLILSGVGLSAKCYAHSIDVSTMYKIMQVGAISSKTGWVVMYKLEDFMPEKEFTTYFGKPVKSQILLNYKDVPIGTYKTYEKNGDTIYAFFDKKSRLIRLDVNDYTCINTLAP
ncbi:MAG: hypothetical protein PHH14_00640 [Candidatus Margulisbacteria bacterium]|nr:hypothetical protein [Candidatus Margulisiibacteriota bacterium]